MYISCLVLSAVFVQLVSTRPLQKKQVTTLSQNDTDTLQLAHHLELLELNLYTGGCNNFTDAEYSAAGFPTGFRDNVCVIAGVRNLHFGLKAVLRLTS